MPLKAVPPAPLGDGADDFGSVVEAVQTQIDDLGIQDERPALCAIALAMARILDNPVALPQHPAAAGRLVETMGHLSKVARPHGRLASVQRMTGGDSGA